MAQLQRHGSLRFSVFEAAVEIGLGPRALDGYIDTIAEEDEPETLKRDAQAISSDEQTDSPFPLTPPSSNETLYRARKLGNDLSGLPRQPDVFSSPPIDYAPFPTTTVPILTARPTPGKLRKPTTPQNIPIAPTQIQYKEIVEKPQKE